MKRTRISLLVAMALILACPGILPAQEQDQTQTQVQQPSDQQLQNEGGWYCPWCGNPGPGRHMMYHEGSIPFGMPQEGMSDQQYQTHQGWGRGQCDLEAQKNLTPMSQDQVRQMLDHYVAANPNLKVGKISDKGGIYEARIVTKDDSLVEKILVNKKTGFIKREY